MEKKITKMGVLLIISLVFIVSMSYARNADISIENAIISDGYFSWEIHITPTDDWGSGNRKALGDCSWYFDANLNALSSPELIYIADEVAESEGYTNTCAITGGHPRVTTDLDYDNYDGVNLTQGINYHLYTVRMTITDPLAESDLYWDELNTGIFNAPDQEVIENYIGNGDITLPVELSSFTATYNTVSGFVSLCWATSSETDVNGFNIYRNTEDSFIEADKINIDLIEGSGTTTETTEYSFTDETADPYYTTYYYWLEVINYGGTSDVHGSYKYIPIDVNNNGELDIITSALNSCYPNPARIGNEIQFNFCVGGLEGTARYVELKVYNVLGKLVAEIVNGERLVNNYTETWRPENLSNGVYFYQLKTENYNEVNKMLLLR